MNAPPPEIARYVAAIGEGPTLLLLEHCAGTRIYAPSGRRGIASLARVVGTMEAAKKLAELLSQNEAGTVRVPLAKQWRARVYRARGMSQAAIARKLGCNEVTVWKYLREATDSPQLELMLPSREDLTGLRAREETGARSTGQTR